MFAALMVVRMREAVSNFDLLEREHGDGDGDGDNGKKLGERRSWLSGDDVDAPDLPLARAAEKVLASMHEVLARTCEGMTAEMRARNREDLDEKTLHLVRSRAAELKLARNLGCLRDPAVEYRAEKL